VASLIGGFAACGAVSLIGGFAACGAVSLIGVAGIKRIDCVAGIKTAG
jgi:hypothetical protein